METELFTLYNVLNFYKSSLLEILNKIDETVLQAITTHESNQIRDSFSNKFAISMEMVSALQHYVKMLHSCETIYDGITVKLTELENSTEPERERRNANPFSLSVVRDNDDGNPPATCTQIKIETPTRRDNTPATPSERQTAFSPIEVSNTPSTVKRERLDSSERHGTGVGTSNKEDTPIIPPRQERTSTPTRPTDISEILRSPNEDSRKNLKVRSDLKRHKVDKSSTPPPETRNSERNNEDVGTSKRRDVTTPTWPERSTSDVDSTTRISKGDCISVRKELKVETQPDLNESQNCHRPLPEVPKRNERSPKKQNQKDQSQVASNTTCSDVSLENSVSSSEMVDAENKKDLTAIRMPRYDWRQEIVQNFENKNLKKTVQWAPTLTQTETVARSDEDKKPKSRNIVSNIAEASLRVNQKCIICHVESPSEFYVRTEESLFESFEHRFNEDMNKQYQYVVNKFKSKREAKTNLGNFCFGFMSSRRKWYRLEVLDWMDHEVDKILVQLIDYGEKLTWNYTHLKVMADFYALFSKMAVRCHLAGIYSPIPDGTRKWPKASIDYFMEISELGAMAQFVTIFVHKEGNSYAVDLRTTKDKNADSLGELLVKNNHAFEVKISQDYDYTEDEDEFENINEAVAGYDARDEARICPFTDDSGGCFKGTSCTLEHGLLSSDGITTDKVLTISQPMTELDLPPAGDIVNILITGYVDTCHFYAQILEEPSNDELFNDKFVRLMDAMQANNVVQTYESFKIYPGIGEIVLVRNESKWYRGRCIGYTDNECLEVFLVDIGYTVIKKLKEVKEMKEDFTYLPFQAVECILDNCQEKKDASRTLSWKFFDSVMKMKTFKGHVMHSTETLRLRLSDADDMDMSHVLKQWGLGEDRDKDFYPVSDCIVVCE